MTISKFSPFINENQNLYRQSKSRHSRETQEISNALIAAEQRIGELLLTIPKASGNYAESENRPKSKNTVASDERATKAEERKRGGTNLVENSPEGNSRRNIGAGTRIILAKKLEPWLREQARAKQSAAGGDKRSEGAKTAFINVDKSDQKEFAEPIHVQKRIADAAKVSTGTLAKFDKVERELRAGK